MEQNIVHHFPVPEHQGIKLLGKSENNMKVLDGQEITNPFNDPLFAFEELAPGAVTVPAGFIGDMDVVTIRIITLILMGRHLRGTTLFQGTHSLQMTQGKVSGV
jgi:hypothetical protein